MERYIGMVDNSADRLQREASRKIAGYYSKALRDINSRLAEYDRKGQLTQNQMLQYNRLNNLEKDIIKEMGKVTGASNATIKSHLGNLYEDAYYRTAFGLEKEVMAKLRYTKLNPDLVDSMIESPFDRVGFLQRSRQNQARLAEQLKQEIFSGLTQGKGYRDIAQTVKKRMDVGATNMDRIVRTESHRVREQAKLDSMVHAEKQGVVAKKRWVATLDDRTRDTHQSMDGEEVAIQKPFKVNGAEGMAPGLTGVPEEDINCRCGSIVVIEGFEPTERRAQGEGVIPYTNYEDWRENRIGD